MTKDNRRILTWSLNAGSQAYEEDIRNYNHKIYSIGLHEFDTTTEGKIRDFRTNRLYFDENGNHTGVRVPLVNERHIVEYPSIKWYFQMVIFGWDLVKSFLDNDVINSEGRLPQDQFLYELDMLIDIYQTHRETGEPLGLTGIEMDVEASMTEDPYSQGYDDKYIKLLERIKNEVLIPKGLKLRVNSYAMWGDGVPNYYRFHNYKMFAESGDKNGNATIDEIQLMTYDFAWSGSSPGASTPIWWFHDVGEWATQCFNPKYNPNAKLTIDNLFFGSAGYGQRWPMNHQDVVKSGAPITYRNLLGWQNGLYRHYSVDYSTSPETYAYKDQDYIYQASIQDEESKNEVMLPHVYDTFKPKYVDVLEHHDGERTATVGNYNRLDYATTNFKTQIPIWDNVVAIANNPKSASGKAFPTAVSPEVRAEAESRRIGVHELPYDIRRNPDTNMDPDDVDFQHLIRTVDGDDHIFVGWQTSNRIYQEKYIYDGQGNVISALCELEEEPDGRINYDINVPSGGQYKLIAITAFSWFTQATLGGYINGTQRFNIGGDDIGEWYPFFMKGVHFYDAGTFEFNSGSNTISVHGELSAPNTPIFGFIVCSDFDQNFSGGELTAKSNIYPFVGKDGGEATFPENFALATKMLRRDARPALLWDDEFRTYEEGTKISDSGYYQPIVPEYKVEGAGTYVEQTGTDEVTGQPVFKCFSNPEDVGFSKGDWIQQDFALYHNSTTADQMVLSNSWSVNLSIDETIEVKRGGIVGIRFHVQQQGSAEDGYLFVADFNEHKKKLILESDGTSKVIASQSLGNVNVGDFVHFRALLHDGIGQFYIDGVQAFIEADGNPVEGSSAVNKSNGQISLERSSGAVGIYANNAEVNVTHLGIGTLDRWEPMEKFEVTVDGITEKYGEIKRTGYSYDEFGYLIYSGLNEVETRDAEQFFDEDAYAVSLDYEFTVMERPSWLGRKDVKIKLRDAGVWFGEVLIGDREGMSIIWTGDAHSFLNSMNMAVNDYGAKGIGLWTMGQEDPYLFELVPDVFTSDKQGGES